MYTLGDLIDSVSECHDLRFLTIHRDDTQELYTKREIDTLDADLLFTEVRRYEIEILEVGCYAHLKVWLSWV